MRDDPDLAWRIVAAGLSGGEWDRAVAEVYTLLILDGVSLNDDLVTRATVILGEWGWRVDEDTTDGRVPPDERSVSYAWHQTYWPLQVLAGAIETGRWPNRATELTDFGRATLFEQIRAEAAGPRSAV